MTIPSAGSGLSEASVRSTRITIAYVDYKDYNMLRKFISDRGKIRARRVTGLCPQHQREAAVAIKRAREMALLPYVVGR